MPLPAAVPRTTRASRRPKRSSRCTRSRGRLVRQASSGDLDALVPLFDGYREFYAQPSEPERDGQGIGFTLHYPLFSSGFLPRMYMLNDLYVCGRAVGALRLVLNTVVNNTAAQRLYGKLGWKRSMDFYQYQPRCSMKSMVSNRANGCRRFIPGDLACLMGEADLTGHALAMALRLPVNRVGAILKEEGGITADTAVGSLLWDVGADLDESAGEVRSGIGRGRFERWYRPRGSASFGRVRTNQQWP